MKFNMGCGHNKKQGYINVDISAACDPDIVQDLELLPWPWPGDSTEEVVFNHSLEHIGGTPRIFLGIMKELYHICKNSARVIIVAPHPRHDFYLGDPTHVRPITPEMLALFDRKLNEQWKKIGAANTPLGIYLGVDFVIQRVDTVLEEPYRSQVASKQMSETELSRILRERNNVASEYHIELTVHKPT